MQVPEVRQVANLQAMGQSRECRRKREVVGTDITRRVWSQLPPTI